MLIVENTAAIIAFVMCLVCFALGYALRNLADEVDGAFITLADVADVLGESMGVDGEGVA